MEEGERGRGIEERWNKYITQSMRVSVLWQDSFDGRRNQMIN